MKNKILILVFGFLFAGAAFAQGNKPVKTTIKVFGNCGECKTRIENALDIKGVKFAEWNIDSKMLEVVYVPDKISIDRLHATIAAVGHDTEKSKAPDSVYLKLPDCCLYRENPNTHHD